MGARSARRRAVERVGWAVTLAAIVSPFSAATPPALGATNTSLHGTVTAAGQPLARARVTLLAGSRAGATIVGRATSDAAGEFAISYAEPTAGVLYVEAAPTAASKLRLRSVVGVGSGGGVSPKTVATVTVNELTTVAAGYALAQFSGPDGISGPSPGLENAAATAFNLADPTTGRPGDVVTNANNGDRNDTLATLRTLANLVSLCAPATASRCERFLALTAAPGGAAPADTAEAVVNLARNPMSSPEQLYRLSRDASVYEPVLDAPPSAWILVLLYTDTELFASGRIAIDATGNVWSSTNWLPGTEKPSTSVTVLDPVGAATFGSPISGGGMSGGDWGAAISPQGVVWMASFGGNALSQYSPAGAPVSPGSGWTNGGLSHPQGLAFDQKGNLWIANNFGPESAPGEGNVVVYPGGDPEKALTISGGGLNHPFAVQIDGYGRAWVTNAGPGGAKLVDTRLAPLIGKFGGSVTVIGTDFKPTSSSPIESSSFKWPLGLAIDSQNNAWVTNYFGSTVTEIDPDGTVAGVYRLPRGTVPWSNAVDGSDRIWVSGFVHPGVWLLCGVNTAACPPGSTTGAVISPKLGFQSKAFQHFTSVQVDQAGNVWLSNNWSQLVPKAGGTGIAEIIGAATPVCAPLEPLPARPSTTSENACPKQAAAALPAALEDSPSDGGSTWLWIAIGAAAAVVLAVAVILVLRRRTAGSDVGP